MDDVRAGLISRLYVYRLDRLSRAGIRATLTIVEELDQCGVELISIADGFAVQGPGRDVVMAVLAWGAQMERQAISDRISAARIRIQAEGGAWGRPRREVDEKRITELRAEGRSIRAIAIALHVPKSTIHRILGQPGLQVQIQTPAVPKTSTKLGPSEPKKCGKKSP